MALRNRREELVCGYLSYTPPLGATLVTRRALFVVSTIELEFIGSIAGFLSFVVDHRESILDCTVDNPVEMEH